MRLQQSLLDYFRMLIGTRGICRIGTGIVLIVGRISFIRQNDGVCIIGVKLYSTTMGMAVDFSITLFLTFAFVWPIWRSKFDKARKLARNSIIAALARSVYNGDQSHDLGCARRQTAVFCLPRVVRSRRHCQRCSHFLRHTR